MYNFGIYHTHNKQSHKPKSVHIGLSTILIAFAINTPVYLYNLNPLNSFIFEHKNVWPKSYTENGRNENNPPLHFISPFQFDNKKINKCKLESHTLYLISSTVQRTVTSLYIYIFVR